MHDSQFSKIQIPQHWQENNQSIVREYKFEDFKQAFEFVTKVAKIAEQLNHHPEIFFTWGKVIITTTTHDAGNQITDKDISLANQINQL